MHLSDSVCSDQKTIDLLLDRRLECAPQVNFALHVEEHGLKRKRAGRELRLLSFGGLIGLLTFWSIPKRESNGTSSFRSPTRFSIRSSSRADSPVTLPQGCARLSR
jgi:hypothetical protein